MRKRKTKSTSLDDLPAGPPIPPETAAMIEQNQRSFSECVKYLELLMRKTILPALREREADLDDYEFELVAICERITRLLGSMVYLDQIVHFQAVLGISRTLFELIADFTLLLYYEDGGGIEGREQRAISRIRAFEKAQRWSLSEKWSKQEKDTEKLAQNSAFRGTLEQEIQDVHPGMGPGKIKSLARGHWLHLLPENPTDRFAKADQWFRKNNPTAKHLPTFEEDHLFRYQFSSQCFHGPGRGATEQYDSDYYIFTWQWSWRETARYLTDVLLYALSRDARMLPNPECRVAARKASENVLMMQQGWHLLEGEQLVNRATELVLGYSMNALAITDWLLGPERLKDLPMKRAPEPPSAWEKARRSTS